MSEHDSFIDEVTEEVRRDRLFALFRKYGWIGVLAVLAIVGGAAANEWLKARAEAQARAFGDAISQAMKNADPGKRATALAAIDAGGDSGRAGILGLLVASQAQAVGDSTTALARLKAVAETESLSPTYRQLARIKMLMIGGTALSEAERDALLADVTAAGAPYRTVGLELKALALLDGGKTDEAVALLGQIGVDADATAAAKARANALLVALGKPPVEAAPPAPAPAAGAADSPAPASASSPATAPATTSTP